MPAFLKELCVLWILLCICGETMGGVLIQRKDITLGVLIPEEEFDFKCTRTAIEMAIDDIAKVPGLIEHQSGNITTHFRLNASFLTAGRDSGSAVESQYRLYKESPIKVATVGPPHKDQNEYCGEYSTANANLHISYSEVNEPLGLHLVMFYQTPPSIVSSFIAARSFMSHFQWSRVGILYDYADERYRKNSENLREILKSAKSNRTFNIVKVQGIWSSPVKYSVSREISDLQEQGVRIILALMSVGGARKVFCEAYQRKLVKPKVIWMFFETLPEDWASDSFNAKYSSKHGWSREVNCTEEQLLSAAKGYISFNNQGLRIDGKKTISNMTAKEFMTKLEKKTGVECYEKVAYAYDAIWVTALAMRNVSLRTDLSTYKYQDFPFGLDLGQVVKGVAFEALTGPLKYQSLIPLASNSRIGQISVHVHTKKGTPIFVGMHDTSTDVLQLFPKAQKLLFEKGVIPKDKANYSKSYVVFSKGQFITIWLISLLGVCMAVGFLIVSIVFKADSDSILNSLTNTFIVIGAILGYLAVIVYGIDMRFVNISSIPDICTAFTYLLAFGFSLTFGSLFVKVWKLYKSYMSPDLTIISAETKSKTVPEWVFLFMIGGFLLLDVAVLLSWTNISPFEYKVKNITMIQDVERDTINVQQAVLCSCEQQTLFSIIIYCYKGLVLLFGLFLVWQTRNAKSKGSTPKHIALSIYNVAAVSLIGVICVTVLASTDQFEATYTIVGVCICLCNTTTLLLIFVPKIHTIMNTKSLPQTNSTPVNGTKKKESIISTRMSPKAAVLSAECLRENSVDLTAAKRESTGTLSLHLDQMKSGSVQIEPTTLNLSFQPSVSPPGNSCDGFLSNQSSSIDGRQLSDPYI